MRSPALLALPTVLLGCSVTASPKPGSLFREYSWVPSGNYHVFTHKQTPIEFSQSIDLVEATSAELAFEIGNAHLGYEEMAFQLNGGEWRTIPFPEKTPRDPSPSLYFNQWYPVIPLPLNEVKSGAGNSILLRMGPQVGGGNPHPAYTPVYGMTLRVYYDAARKPHTSGVASGPKANSMVGASVPFQVNSFGPVAQVDYLGEYEGPNYEGDGVYRQWHYHLFRGKIVHHIGTAKAGETSFVWDTSWIPDQPLPMQFAARITDPSGLVFVTPTVANVTMKRSFRVELVKPFDVPQAFTACQYGIYVDPGPKYEKLDVQGNIAQATEAQLVVPCWNCPSAHGFTLNGIILDDVVLTGTPGGYNVATVDLLPLSALRKGVNRLGTVPGPGRMSDVHLPGVQLLIRYGAN